MLVVEVAALVLLVLLELHLLEETGEPEPHHLSLEHLLHMLVGVAVVHISLPLRVGQGERVEEELVQQTPLPELPVLPIQEVEPEHPEVLRHIQTLRQAALV
jgi:hypothetical protein